MNNFSYKTIEIPRNAPEEIIGNIIAETLKRDGREIHQLTQDEQEAAYMLARCAYYAIVESVEHHNEHGRFIGEVV